MIDAAAMRRVAGIKLPGRARTLAISPDGARAVVTLAGDKVAVLDLTALKAGRRLSVPHPGGVDFDSGGRAWVSGTVRNGAKKGRGGRLIAIDPGTARVVKTIRTGRIGGAAE